MMDHLFRMMGALSDAETPLPISSKSGSGQRNYQAEMNIRQLENNLAKMYMIAEALWELCSEKLKITEKQLYDKLYEIDMRDGVLDGKNQRKAGPCPKCNRPVSQRHNTCLYCGEVLDTSVFSMD
jgi:hypothetical protein